MNAITDSFRVAWIDMCYVRHNILSILVTCLVSPLLYLVAFGYGLGQGMTVEGFDYISFMIPGVIALSTLTSCFSTVSTKVMTQRVYYQSFDELFLCSMSPVSIVLGKSYAGVVRGLISAFILYALGLCSVDALPGVAQAIIGVLPLTHTTGCIRASILGTAFPWTSLLIILVFGFIFAAVSVYVVRKGRS